ncbi:MAG: hypothetical protein HKO56_06705 [Bacteroidia bacterium]|nr:hypothetical protein [Bacteroidia bacterium]NNC84942.1 hypothetical protein [Bacteroidia bacterium]NNM16329.1 hypothetical protein [Bacteroidia bacterium]
MKKLTKNWITEKYVDFEYKKYVLLAYLQEVNESFDSNCLYPHLGDLITHYKNLVSLKENKTSLYNKFPAKITSADFNNFKLVYEKILEDDKVMKEIESIIDFSLPHFEHYMIEGKNIYDFFESNINIFPIGVMPLHRNEGYLLLKGGDGNNTMVYQFHISLFGGPTENLKGISTEFICDYETSITNTYEGIKQKLIEEIDVLPNPATYAIESDLSIPVKETFLPLAKRSLVKCVSSDN